MAVITIAGQLGAGGEQLALRLSQKLDYYYVDRKTFENVLKEYGIVDCCELLDQPLHFLDRFAGEKRDTADLLNKMYLIFAKQNNIILYSRRAYLVLESFVNVCNVFIKAPRATRIQNLMTWEEIGQRSATEKVQEEAQARKSIIESFYKKRWDSFSPWTLVLDTHKLGLELAERCILEANTRVAECDEVCGWQDGFPSIDTIEVDPILEKAVHKMMIDNRTSVPGKEA